MPSDSCGAPQRTAAGAHALWACVQKFPRDARVANAAHLFCGRQRLRWLRRLERLRRLRRLRRRLRGLLAMDGRGLDPYLLVTAEREAALRKVLKRTRRGIRYVEHTEGDGAEGFKAVCKLGLEGIVSKN